MWDAHTALRGYALSLRASASAVLLTSCLVGCEATDPDAATSAGITTEATFEVVDDAGATHRFAEAPHRVVSLVPSATEVLVRIGAADRLAGRTDFDTMAEVAELPSVGGGLQPNLEAVLARDPDLVVYFVGESEQATPRRLSEAGVRAFGIRPDGIADVFRIIEALGTIMERADEAASLREELEAGLRSAGELAAGGPPVRAVFTLGGEPPLVAGGGTYVGELISLVGGENVFADVEGFYAPVSIEEFLTRDIDVILVVEGTVLPEQLQAAEVREVPDLVQFPGPRLHLAAESLARALHDPTGSG